MEAQKYREREIVNQGISAGRNASGLLTKILWLMGPIKRLLFEALQLPLSAYPYALWRLRLCGTLQKS